MIRSRWLAVLLAGALVALFWLPAIQVPFWQDDFRLLLDAREAREAGEGWFSAFWPSEKSIFWRPLSEGVYWRVVEGLLHASPLVAHVLNLLVLTAASLAVAWLVTDYARVLRPELDWGTTFFIAGLLYGIHAAHFLPAVWVTAVHTSMVVLFSALTLRFWIAALRQAPAGLTPGLLAIPLLLLPALFSKESGILVLPLGALLTAVAWKRARPTRAAWFIAVVSLLLALAWLRVRQGMIVPPSGAYEVDLGVNALRNLASMTLFAFNVPRESLRFVLEQQSLLAALWGLACAGLMAAAVWPVVAGARSRLGVAGAAAVVAFFLIGVAPHLLFSWNAYAYYVTLGLIAWPFLAVYAGLPPRRMRFVAAAAWLSALLSVGGNHVLDYPALLARAHWADGQLALLREAFPAVAERARAEGIAVAAENPHKFLGIGIDGLAFTFDLPRTLFREVGAGESPTGPAVRLIVPDIGDAYFQGWDRE